MNIGKNIRACREFKKISRNELASMLDVNVSSISRYELGTREPNMATIQSISNALDVEMDALLNGFSKDIYTKEDVFSLYHKLNTRTKLSKFLGFTDDYDMRFIALKEGAGSLDLYFKLGGYLNLTDDQIYNWILSDCITCLIGYDDFKVSNVNYDDIKYIIDNNILKKQSVDSLINKGLSKENETLLKDYFSSKNKIQLKTLKTEKNSFSNCKNSINESTNKILKSNIESYEDKETIKFMLEKLNVNENMHTSKFIPKELIEKDIELLNHISKLEKKVSTCEDLNSKIDVLSKIVLMYNELTSNYKNIISYLEGSLSASTNINNLLLERLFNKESE